MVTSIEVEHANEDLNLQNELTQVVELLLRKVWKFLRPRLKWDSNPLSDFKAVSCLMKVTQQSRFPPLNV